MAVQYQPSGPYSRWEWGCTISQKPYESIYHLRSFPGIHTKYSDFYLIGQHLLTSLYKRGYETHFIWLHWSPQDNQGSAGRKKKKKESGYWAGNQQIWPQPPYKESSYNARDPSSIPGSGRSAGEGIGYPLQSSWAFPVAQLVKNLPTMRETRVWSWVGKNPWTRERLPTPIFWLEEFLGLYGP